MYNQTLGKYGKYFASHEYWLFRNGILPFSAPACPGYFLSTLFFLAKSSQSIPWELSCPVDSLSMCVSLLDSDFLSDYWIVERIVYKVASSILPVLKRQFSVFDSNC